jgi:hypothetical protein
MVLFRKLLDNEKKTLAFVPLLGRGEETQNEWKAGKDPSDLPLAEPPGASIAQAVSKAFHPCC